MEHADMVIDFRRTIDIWFHYSLDVFRALYTAGGVNRFSPVCETS